MLAATSVASLVIYGLGGTTRAQTPAASETPAPAPSPAPAENAPTPPAGNAPAVPGGNAPRVLPETKVEAPKQAAKPKQKPPVVTREATPAPAAPAPTAEQAQAAANRQVVQQTQNLDQRRDNVLLPKIGTSNYTLTQSDIESLPQGNAVQLSDLALQFPGVYQDSTSQGDFHVRNEHGNIQYRINGILLPDGVSGFSQILETSFISNMQLLTGALPAQYGLHTSGIFDITTKTGAALSGGSVSIYGGSRQTVTPSFEYGGVEGNTDYYVTGRYLSTGLGLEAATSALNGIHDHSEQGRFFAYTSTLLDPTARVVTISGFAETRYQIPNKMRFSRMGCQGTSRKPNPSSIIAKRPLAREATPVRRPLTYSPFLLDVKVKPRSEAISRPTRSTSRCSRFATVWGGIRTVPSLTVA